MDGRRKREALRVKITGLCFAYETTLLPRSEFDRLGTAAVGRLLSISSFKSMTQELHRRRQPFIAIARRTHYAALQNPGSAQY